MDLKERVKKARALAGFSQAQLASNVGMGQASLSDLESGKSLSSRYLLAIAKACNVNPMWLQTGEGEMQVNQISYTNSTNQISSKVSEAEVAGGIYAWDDQTPLETDEVELPLVKDVELSAGEGKLAVSEYTSKSKVRFGKSTLRNRNVDYRNSICVIVKGSSMEPNLPDGATVGVDMSKTDIVDGKVYAVAIENELLRIKQLFRLPGNRVRLRSFNREEYEDEEYSLEQVRVIGRLFWSSVLW